MHRRSEIDGFSRRQARSGGAEASLAAVIRNPSRNTGVGRQVSEEGSPGPEPPLPPEHEHVAMSSHTLHVQVHWPLAEHDPRLHVTLHSSVDPLAYALRTAAGSTNVPSPVTSAAMASWSTRARLDRFIMRLPWVGFG
jgi:hypothetical protein